MNLFQPKPADDQQLIAFDREDDATAAAVVPARGAPASRMPWSGALRAAVRRHRRVVAATMLIVLAAAAACHWLIPPRFTAQADLWLDHGFDEAPQRGEPADPRSRNTEIRLVTSNGLLAAVVDKLGLANVRGVGQPRDGAMLPRAEARTIAIATLRDNLKVRSTDTSYAVAVSYAAPGPVLASGILNQTLDTYVEERRSGGARGREQLRLRDEVAKARDEAMRAQAALDGYRAAASVIAGEDDANAAKVEIEALQTELRAAEAARTQAEARLGGVRGDRADPAGVTSPQLAALRAQQRQLRSDMAAAEGAGQNRFGIGGVNGRLAAIERDIAAETRRASALVAATRRARDRASLLKATRMRLENRLSDRTKAIAELARLGGAAAAAHDSYIALNSRYATQTSARRTAPGTAYVISHANPAAARGFPSPALLALAGLLAALIAAGAVVALIEAFVKGFRSRHHLERTLGINVIGQVPNLARTRDADLDEDDPMGPPDYLYTHPRSAFGAAFRTIHTGLHLGGGANSTRSVAICSALQTEGKTTVAICLARSAAMAGLRVVLVDCDARRPAASRALSAHVELGLIDVLTRGVAFRDALQRDTPSGAWFLAQSSDRPTPSEAIGSDRMVALIAKLSQEFDLVILDTPPTLALAESRALAAMADAALLVVRARTTPVGAARIAQRMLADVGVTVTGAVLTLVDP